MHGQGASNINCSTIVFIFDVCRLSKPVSSTNYAHTGLLNGLSHIGQVSLPRYTAVIPDRSIFHVDIRSLSNDDGDGNENGNRLAKQQLDTSITLFCTFLSPCCTTYNVRVSNLTFCPGRELKTTTFFFFS